MKVVQACIKYCINAFFEQISYYCQLGQFSLFNTSKFACREKLKAVLFSSASKDKMMAEVQLFFITSLSLKLYHFGTRLWTSVVGKQRRFSTGFAQRYGLLILISRHKRQNSTIIFQPYYSQVQCSNVSEIPVMDRNIFITHQNFDFPCYLLPVSTMKCCVKLLFVYWMVLIFTFLIFFR